MGTSVCKYYIFAFDQRPFNIFKGTCLERQHLFQCFSSKAVIRGFIVLIKAGTNVDVCTSYKAVRRVSADELK